VIQIAYEAGKHEAAQAWLLMASLLTDIVPPPTPPPSPPPQTGYPGISHSASAPAAISNIPFVAQPTAEPSGRSLSAESVLKNGALAEHKNSSPSRPSSLHATPSSSNPSSPHRGPVVLPPTTPVPIRTSVSPLNRRGSGAGLDQGTPRRLSSYSHSHSRPSISTSTQSESPSDSTKGHGSHRHVGEGALDDSDSSDGGDGPVEDKADGGGSSDEESGLRPLISPYQSTRVVPTTPSPLSHIAGQQQWTEDEEDDGDDDDVSPSPGSTDTESSNPEDGAKRKKYQPSHSRQNSHAKSRSRSSTVASLAASSLLHAHKPLSHRQSHTSIRTVTGGDLSVGEPDYKEETVMDLSGKTFSPEPRETQRSRAVSSDVVSNAPEEVEVGKRLLESTERTGKISEKRKRRIKSAETMFREMGWDTLRATLERFTDEGDVQMCSMLSVVAPQELQVEKRRIARYFESYIGSFGVLIYI
jgi:hypothetical protein